MKKEFSCKKLIAHRGIHDVYLENSLESFREAIKRGNPIEFDVQLSKDNEVVVFHDKNVKRLFGVDRDINDMTLKEIRYYKYIKTLKEVLSFINGRVPIFIELKVYYKIGKLEEEVAELLKSYNGDFFIISFNPLSLLWMRINYPKYKRGYLVHNIVPKNYMFLKYFLNYYLLSFILFPYFIGINLESLPSNRVKKIRKKYTIIGYTIKNKEEISKYLPYADCFISDIKTQETS